jgi:DNA polymerase-3 subunit delta
VAKDGPSLAELLSGLKGGTLLPAYLLHGEEDFLLEQGLDAILDRAFGKEERSFNLDVVYGGEVGSRDLMGRLSSLPMMGERRVLVVRDADKLLKDTLESLAAYLEHPSPTTCLVMAGAKPDFRKKPFSTMKKGGMAYEFGHLYEDKIPAWIESYVKKSGRRIDPAGAKLLTAQAGRSLREVQNEIEKLYIYVNDRNSITEDDVAAVVGMTKEFTVFELQKALGWRETARAVAITDRMIETGEKLPGTIAALTAYFTLLWKCHDLKRDGIAPRDWPGKARINPYFLNDYVKTVEITSAGAVERAFLHLARADEQSKTTGADDRDIMHALVLNICGGIGDVTSDAGNQTMEAGV